METQEYIKEKKLRGKYKLPTMRYVLYIKNNDTNEFENMGSFHSFNEMGLKTNIIEKNKKISGHVFQNIYMKRDSKKYMDRIRIDRLPGPKRIEKNKEDVIDKLYQDATIIYDDDDRTKFLA